MLYGTAWKGAQTTSLVVQAVLQGFRGIDTAGQPKVSSLMLCTTRKPQAHLLDSQHYSQDLVGEALEVLKRDHGIPREQIFLQTKFTSLDGQDLSKPLPYDRGAPLDQQVSSLRSLSANESFAEPRRFGNLSLLR